MEAQLCLVCGGTGKYTPPQDPFSSAVTQPQTCHGCGGTGWIAVPKDYPKGEWVKEEK